MANAHTMQSVIHWVQLPMFADTTLLWSLEQPIGMRLTLIMPGVLDPPSLVTVSQGSGGNMKAALWIWSAISSSSLKGKVPLRLHTQTGGNHDNRMGKIKKLEAGDGCYSSYQCGNT